MQVEREVLREDTILENIIEQAFVAGAEPDGVVGEVGVSAIGAKINEKEGHAVAHAVQFAVGPFAAGSGGDLFLVKISDVGIGDDDLGPQGFA